MNYTEKCLQFKWKKNEYQKPLFLSDDWSYNFMKQSKFLMILIDLYKWTVGEELWTQIDDLVIRYKYNAGLSPVH